MSGVRGRSGPPKNTNASKYGWRVLARRGFVRPQDAWVVRPMEQTSARLLNDKPDASAHEAEVIEIITRMKGCALLCWEAVHRDGLLKVAKGQVQVHAVSEELRRYVKLELDALRLLPPARRARPVQSLQEYLAERASAIETDSKEGD